LNISLHESPNQSKTQKGPAHGCGGGLARVQRSSIDGKMSDPHQAPLRRGWSGAQTRGVAPKVRAHGSVRLVPKRGMPGDKDERRAARTRVPLDAATNVSHYRAHVDEGALRMRSRSNCFAAVAGGVSANNPGTRRRSCHLHLSDRIAGSARNHRTRTEH
jgi:hypothetical protein